MILSVPSNHGGRDFVIGDLHGCFSDLNVLLKNENFDSLKDRVFAVGDLCDRGSDSQNCIELLERPWFFSVRGNHEAMMLAWYHAQGIERLAAQQRWCQEGGEWFFNLSVDRQYVYCQRVELLPCVLLIECQGINYCLLHAEIPPELGEFEVFLRGLLEGEPAVLNACLRGRRRHRSRYQQPVAGIDIILSGHTPVRFPQVCTGNAIRLDFGAGQAGKYAGLGMLELGTNRLLVRYPDRLYCYDLSSFWPGMQQR